MPQKSLKRILLVDHHDLRRDTREQVLRKEGYEIVTADRFDLVEGNVQEATFDLVVVCVAGGAAGVEAVAYSRRLRAANADLPILALSDNGLHLPKGSRVTVVQSGYPLELIAQIGKMLLESTHIRNNKKMKLSGAEND
jgi:DNA-binding response OmpR family regulator